MTSGNSRLHEKLGSFLVYVLENGMSVSWTERIERLLKAAIESAEMKSKIFIARIAVMLFVGLSSLYDSLMGGDTLVDGEPQNPLEYILNRCSSLITVLTNCAKFKPPSTIIASELMPLLGRPEKAYLLDIEGIEAAFSVDSTEYNLRMLVTLRELINREDVRARAFAIATSPSVLERLTDVVEHYCSMRCVRLAYALAIDIQK